LSRILLGGNRSGATKQERQQSNNNGRKRADHPSHRPSHRPSESHDGFS